MLEMKKDIELDFVTSSADSHEEINTNIKQTAPPNHIGFTQADTIQLSGLSSSFYPKKNSWLDPNLLNTNDFRRFQTPEGAVMVQPLNPGLYRFEFSSNVYARAKSAVRFVLLRYPGNHQEAIFLENFSAGDTRAVYFYQLVRASGNDMYYLALRQFETNGDAVITHPLAMRHNV